MSQSAQKWVLGLHQGRAWPPAQPRPAGHWLPAVAPSHGRAPSPVCVFSPRIPPHPASRGSPSHPPPPAAAEGAAHLLRDPRQHLLHRQDQLSGSGPIPTPSALPQTGYPSQRQTSKEHFVHFSVREAVISDRKVPRAWRPVCAQQAAQQHSAQTCVFKSFTT